MGKVQLRGVFIDADFRESERVFVTVGVDEFFRVFIDADFRESERLMPLQIRPTSQGFH